MPEEVQSSTSSDAAVKVEEKKGPVETTTETKSVPETKEEARDESEAQSRGSKGEDRESATSVKTETTAKRSQAKPKGKNSNSSHQPHASPQRSYGHDNFPPSYGLPGARPPYPPPHAMHGVPRGHPTAPGPFAPPPPPYYGAAPHDPYRGPPPPHYHQMPPLPHPAQYGPTGHYGPPPNMAGRPGPPPGYPTPYGANPFGAAAPMAYGAPPLPHPSYSHPSSSDNNSISSSKSKGSHVSKSTKSSQGGKKRTIDGVHSGQDMTHAYSFRRTNSSTSSNSTVTASNTDIHPLLEESPRKRDRSSSRPYSRNGNIFGEERYHRRHPSNASTTSSLSVGGFSLHSYEGNRGDLPMMKASPKRRKGSDSAPLAVDTGLDKRQARSDSSTDSAIDARESSRFQQLSMNDSEKKREENGGSSLFLSLSTSPINHPEVDATPIKDNTKPKAATKITIKTDLMEEDEEVSSKKAKPSPFRKPSSTSNSATPAATLNRTESGATTDEHLLNKHLRGQTFTPLPHLTDQSPSNAVFGSINPALSWSIAGDTPSLEDLAACSWDDHDKTESRRPGSTTSQLSTSTREMVISPHNFSLWKEEHETNHRKGEEGKDNDTVRLSMLSPHSEIGMGADGVTGTTTPLPLFFHDNSGSEERENAAHGETKSSKQPLKDGENGFMNSGNRGSTMNPHHPNPQYGWKHDSHGAPPTPVYGSKPPTPLYAGSNMGFARSPLHGDGHRMMFGHPPPHTHNDRVRNLRGRVPPGAHMPPMPLHIPPPMSSHHPLTSPMGIGGHGKPMWSPHHSMPPPMASPHHLGSPLNMSQSKRKCVPLKPPIPSKFQGDMDKMKGATVPEFTSLVNFPAHMSQKQSVNLPEGMRCCVMCGSACPCSTGNKKKGGKGKNDGSLAPRNTNGQDASALMGEKGSYAIIPTQNKGLCTSCDVNVWVVVNNGLEIKWCKGCKNFRPWAAFGDKGLATKCLRCRERQREKYALQKEEKEKARLLKGQQAKAGLVE